ncbi:universal stress protein [Clostridium kluyveri]|uniref:universal stress protein n=1 Tax=Clostridium kluyveri TaxID=1534 RepID=UPI002247FFE2|nr:universal stress protein [Clostridium kluyveri]UZQ50800.1 universal stress protein [Clostridium kluyveri]
MTKRKILIPVDGTDRSMHSLDWIKKLFEKDEIQVTLMNVVEMFMAKDTMIKDKMYRAQQTSHRVLDKAEKELEGYEVEKYLTFGYADDRILKKAEQDKFDMIVMTRSTKTALDRMIGSVTSKIIKNANTLVAIIPE